MKRSPLLLGIVALALTGALVYAGILSFGGDMAKAKPRILLPQPSDDNLHSNSTPDGNLVLSSALDNPYYLTENGAEYVYYYVSLKAGKVELSQERLPLNLSMVIDRSGSMDAEGKMNYAIKAAQTVVSNLADKDQLSIVSYDDYVTVEHKSGKITDKGKLKAALASLFPRGSTNLGAGMLQGYDEVKSTFASGYINRVLLLSDGLANQGITDAKSLSNITKEKYSKQGIAISTFGVGADFNEDLMTSLAEYGRGNYYYIDKSDKIPGIFERELNGLLAIAAKGLKVGISYPAQYFDVVDVDGYKYEMVDGRIVVDLNDIVSEEEKILLVKFRVKEPITEAVQFVTKLEYELAYGDKTKGTLGSNATLTPTADEELYASSGNTTVYKNVIIYEANKKYEEATKLADQGKYDDAQLLLMDNALYFEQNEAFIEGDTLLERLRQQNDEYNTDLDKAEEMGDGEFKSFQKLNKTNVYDTKKRK